MVDGNHFPSFDTNYSMEALGKKPFDVIDNQHL